jgi:diguanylate cyclase (GGDEF)-like protein
LDNEKIVNLKHQVALFQTILNHAGSVLVDGEIRDYLSVKFPIRDEKGVLFATGLVATDITERKKNESIIYKMAHTDQLTQLSNRAHFNQRFDETIELAKRENKKLALLMIDLDNFKPVNDTYGHQIGDRLLQKVAGIFKKVSRDTDIAARIGGDEFAIILVYPDNKKMIKLIAKRIVDEINKPIIISEHNINIGVSVGIAIFPDDEEDKEKIIYKADLALYEAKKNGRNTFKFYEPKSRK